MNGEPPSFCSSNEVKARINHYCYECGRTAIPGKLYHRFDGVWDGEWEHYEFCLQCWSMHCKIIEENISEDGITFGCLKEWCQESGIVFPPTERMKDKKCTRVK